MQTLLKSMATIPLFAHITVAEEGPSLGVPEQLPTRGPLKTMSMIVRHRRMRKGAILSLLVHNYNPLTRKLVSGQQLFITVSYCDIP